MAKPVSVTVSHELGRDAALERIRSGFDRVGDALGFGVELDQEWRDDTLHFGARAMGQSVSGDVEVFENHIRITLVMPALLAGMADMVLGKIRKQSALLLEKK